jgi:hypothetical protein
MENILQCDGTTWRRAGTNTDDDAQAQASTTCGRVASAVRPTLPMD